MSEKEFLHKFLFEYSRTNKTRDEAIDKFLEEHHKEYCEVEFIKLEDENEWGVDPPGGKIYG